MRTRVGLIGLLWAITLANLASGTPHSRSDTTRRALGVTHVAGRYSLTDQDYLNEGADQILRLGAGCIKLYLTNPAKNYPFKSEWPSVRSLVDIAQTPYFRKVFSKPFHTYILTAYRPGISDHYWTRGISPEQKQAETRALRELTRHLLTMYRGTSKTFVLQHWEGDWALRGGFDPARRPSESAIQGMIGWLKARQKGVEEAKKEVGEKGVRVLHAAEVNLVRQSMEKHAPGVTTDVLPHVKLDLISYSAWDTQEDPKLLRTALDFISRRARTPSPRDVYIGEFGLPENERSAEDVVRVSRGVVDTALSWGCPYVVYWQIYCNEARQTPVKQIGDVRGFWLLRPDGSKAAAWAALRSLLTSNTN